jgi:hypothetical protein
MTPACTVVSSSGTCLSRPFCVRVRCQVGRASEVVTVSSGTRIAAESPATGPPYESGVRRGEQSELLTGAASNGFLANRPDCCIAPKNRVTIGPEKRRRHFAGRADGRARRRLIAQVRPLQVERVSVVDSEASHELGSRTSEGGLGFLRGNTRPGRQSLRLSKSWFASLLICSLNVA